MAERLWAPWRIEYIREPKTSTGCALCAYASVQPSRSSGVLARGASAYVVLNKYPYSSAHLMVVPARHLADLSDLTSEEHSELFGLLTDSAARLRRVTGAEGLNIGINLGSAAGAGIQEHLHIHLVPRWVGDHNFMPVIAGTTVIPEYLESTWDHLAADFRELSREG